MTKCDCSRRQFLKTAVAGAAAISVAPVPILPTAEGANAPDNGKFLVIVNLFGGNDGLNTVIPTHRQPYYDRRPTLALSDADGILDLDGRYKLHPALGNVKAMWDDGDLHAVNLVGYPNQNLSHFTSMNIYSWGVRDNSANGDGRGWLGRFADAYCSNPVEPLGVISVGTGRRRDFEANTGEALVLGSVAGFDILADNNYATDHALRRQVMKDILQAEAPPAGGVALTTYGTSRQAHELVERVQTETAGWTDPGTYLNTTLGNRMRAISQLLHARTSFGTRVLYTGFGGFDTHADQATRHANLLTQLNDALGAFADDMKARGMWNDCVVLVISEFGRRNFENGSAGTDHGHGNCFLAAGGGVSPGITGDVTEADINENQPDFTYDFREVYGDLIENHIGVPAAPLFPEAFTDTGDVSLIP